MKKVVTLPSFNLSVHKLTRQEQERVAESLEKFSQFVYSSQISHGLGLKKLDHSLYEFRAGIRVRVVVESSANTYYLIMAGDHDDVKRYLRQH